MPESYTISKDELERLLLFAEIRLGLAPDRQAFARDTKLAEKWRIRLAKDDKRIQTEIVMGDSDKIELTTEVDVGIRGAEGSTKRRIMVRLVQQAEDPDEWRIYEIRYAMSYSTVNDRLIPKSFRLLWQLMAKEFYQKREAELKAEESR